MRTIVILSLIVGGLIFCPPVAAQQDWQEQPQETRTPSYVPTVTVVPEVYTPQGDMRTYRTARGVSYYHAGLPIYRGDNVRLNVFVATGGANLAEAIVRLNNVEIGRRTGPPWNVNLDTGPLAQGYHYIEAFARTGGANPQSSTANMVLFVDPRQAEQATTVSDIVDPLPAPGDLPVLQIDQGAGGPAVQVTSEDATARQHLTAGTPVSVNRNIIFSVSGPGPDEGYVYALYRGGQELHRSQVLPLTHRVQIRPDSPGQPGLLPGDIKFVVWGSDRAGRLGPPRVIDLHVMRPGAADPVLDTPRETGFTLS
jgi:hypothetical protein